MADAFGYTGIPTTLYVRKPSGEHYATLIYDGSFAWESVAETMILEEIHAAPRLRDYTTASAASGSWSANDGVTAAYDSFTVNGILYSIWATIGSLPDAIGTMDSPSGRFFLLLLD